jgi:hypothetical protein
MEETMAGIHFLKVHRSWEDWVGIVLGLLIGMSPWFAGQVDQSLMLNAFAVGAAVFMLAQFELVDLHRWEETGEILCGLWLIASPFVFGYAEAGALATWHFALGGIVVLLAVFELWQDWALTDEELVQQSQ